MVSYYEQLLVVKELKPSPQHRADAGFKAIKTLEGLVKLQTEEYVAMQGQLRDKNAALSHTTGQLAVQEQQHRDATAELHEV
eukprot:8017477-Pyramimonas_sp.AAC.1